MKKIYGGAPENAKELNPELQEQIIHCEIQVCELENLSAERTYLYDTDKAPDTKELFSTEYDYFINCEIWSVRKMLPEEFDDHVNEIMIHYLYAFISNFSDYYYNNFGYDKRVIANTVFGYIKEDNYWGDIDFILTSYLENLNLPEEHRSVMNEYKKWKEIIG